MIYQHKINSLSDEQKALLLYCINDSNVDEINRDLDYLKCLKVQWVFDKLNEWAAKIKDEHKVKLQEIADIITK